MKHGKLETTQTLDDNGSTKATSENYKDGIVVGQVRERYEERYKVANELEEIAQYHKFANANAHDPTRLDPEFKIVGRSNMELQRKGYYFVVHCYTRLLN